MPNSTFTEGDQPSLFKPGTDGAIAYHYRSNNVQPKSCHHPGVFSAADIAALKQHEAVPEKPTDEQVAAVTRAAHELDEHV